MLYDIIFDFKKSFHLIVMMLKNIQKKSVKYAILTKNYLNKKRKGLIS